MLWKMFNTNKITDRDTPINELLSNTRAINKLLDEKIYTCNDLIGRNVFELLRIPNMGVKSVEYIIKTWIKSGHKVKNYKGQTLKRFSGKNMFLKFEW